MDLERAIEIAASAHRGQLDKLGDPFILHPLRVMAATQQPRERIVAVLHDLVEKTDWTLDALRRAGLQKDLLGAVGAMTRQSGEPYPEFVERAARNALARPVKIADLRDNLATTSIAPSPEIRAKAEKYAKALRQLGIPPG